ncbi:MAG: SusC/RagA family TonB-linked outer membrane protein [Candidatus Cyclobacteriaceae bacterium M3_2C_046]
MRKILQVTLWLIVYQSGFLFAQDQSISGKVTAQSDGSPIPGVNVVFKGTNLGTITDLDGNFQLNVPETDGTLVFSYIGMTTKEVPINNRSVVEVQLKADVRQLNEIVVTSFGIEQEKKSLGYATQELQKEEITKTKQPNLINAMQGQVAGVQISNSGGAPGQSARIIIRGVNSLDPSADNQPLFVVDGVPIDNSTVESPGTPRGMSNRVADINPNDIESVNVLKGAAATALYGVRAANGAVIITTKKGKAGRIKVDFSSSVGGEDINNFPDFQQRYGQGFSGAYQPTSFWPNWGAPIPAARVIDPDHQYYDIFRDGTQTGLTFDNTISVSGGNENSTFYASVSNLDQQGTIPNSDWGRTSAKVAGTVTSDQFKFSGSLNYTNSGGNRVPHDRHFETLMYWSSTQDVTDYIKPDGTQRAYSTDNPIYSSEFWTYEDDVNRVIGNVNFEYSPLEWLSFQYRIGTDTYSDSRQEILPGPLGVVDEIPLSSTGFIREDRINSRDINSTLNITLQGDLTDRLSTTLRLGNDIFDRRFKRLSSFGGEFVIPQFYNLSNTTDISTNQFISERRLVGLYGDLMLNYDDFLFLNITGRNDWSSTLPKANNSFFYPSFNLGFIFNDIMGLPSWFSYGKLRASYAEVGKDAPPYSTAVTYTAPVNSGGGEIFPLNGQVGFTRSNQLGTPELKPERTTSYELGAELRFFENNIGIDFTWYQSNSADQILSVPVSNATGFTSLITNAGEIRNSGFELVLNATPLQINDFRWDIRLNLSRNWNEVVEIREGIESIFVGSQFGYAGSTVNMQLIEGDPFGNIYGRSYERYYADGQPENLRYLDRDLPLLIDDTGFPEINSDQLILGNVTPEWLGGISNTFSYKSIDFSFLIDWRTGVDQFTQFGNFFSAFGILDYSLDRNAVVVFDGVTSDGSPNTQQVWLGQGIGPDGNNYGAGFWRNRYRGSSENFVQDASFLKLRNITLTYNFPSSLLNVLPISNGSFSLAANNLILATPWEIFDPESFSAGAGSNAIGFTGLAYPGTRSYFATLNLSF